MHWSAKYFGFAFSVPVFLFIIISPFLLNCFNAFIILFFIRIPVLKVVVILCVLCI